MKAAFLDRDGVINRDLGYVYRREDFEFLPNAIAGMKQLVSAGYRIIVVTNQSGIARGYYDEETFQCLADWMCEALAAEGVPVLAVYHCPHHPDGVVQRLTKVCDCRKPAPGMLLRAKEEHRIDMTGSIMIGDKQTDVAAGVAAGVGRVFLIGSLRAYYSGADAVYADLLTCSEQL